MVKGSIQNTEPRGAAGPLRDKIRDMEIGLAKLKRLSGEDVAALLKLRDEIAHDVAALTEQGVDLRPELTRITSIDGMLTSKAGIIVRKGLATARRAENPPEDHWWWYLDGYLAEQQRKWLIRTGAIIAGVLLVVLIGNWVMDRFFGMSPTEKQAFAHTSRADQLLMNGDLAGAVAEYEQSLIYVPDDGDVLAALGILYEAQGQTAKSEEMLTRARQAFENPEGYWITVAQTYRLVGEKDKAMEAVNTALEVQPESAYAYYVRGIIHQEAGETFEALQDYEQAANLASEQNQNELFVMARSQYGMVLQSGAGF